MSLSFRPACLKRLATIASASLATVLKALSCVKRDSQLGKQQPSAAVAFSPVVPGCAEWSPPWPASKQQASLPFSTLQRWTPPPRGQLLPGLRGTGHGQEGAGPGPPGCPGRPGPTGRCAQARTALRAPLAALLGGHLPRQSSRRPLQLSVCSYPGGGNAVGRC